MREIIAASSSLNFLADRAEYKGRRWPDMIESESSSTEMARFPGFSDRDLMFLHARYIEGHSHQELADRFGLSEQTSWVLLNRLKRRLLRFCV